MPPVRPTRNMASSLFGRPGYDRQTASPTAGASRFTYVKVGAGWRATKEANLAGSLSESNGHADYDRQPASPTTGASRFTYVKVGAGWRATKEANLAGSLSESN
jgi:hypothetical protein